MNVKIRLYDSSKGDATALIEEIYDLNSFDELKSKILEIHNVAIDKNIIKGVESKDYVIVNNEIKYVETSIYVYDVFDSFHLITCWVNTDNVIFFAHHGSDYDSSYAEEKLGPLDFNLKDFEADDLVEKLFNYFLTKL